MCQGDFELWVGRRMLGWGDTGSPPFDWKGDPAPVRKPPTDREFREWVREMESGVMKRFHEALDDQP